jgi:hypothetical protein
MRHPCCEARASGSCVLRAAAALLALLIAVCAGPARAATSASDAARDGYLIAARLDPDAATIRGTVEIRLVNRSRTPLERAYLHLYPNRFLRDGDEVNDVTRMHVYPENAFHPGSIDIESATGAGGAALAHRTVSEPGTPADTVLEIDLGAALGPGAATTITLAFTTLLPERYGPLGVTEEGFTAVAGWYPYLVDRTSDGEWLFTGGPASGDVTATVSAPEDLTLVVGSAVFGPAHAPTVQASARNVRTFALIALRQAMVWSGESAGTRITFVAPIPLRAHRVATGPPAAEVLHAAVERAIELRPASVPAPPALTVVQVPLRWNLTTPSDGVVVVSDRAMQVQELLRNFHEAQVVQAVYAELLRNETRGCADEPPRWVTDGVAWELAERYLVKTRPEHHSVHDWIDWFDFFAIVDRFETAPKIPFVQSFFENAQNEDEVRESVFTFAGRRPPARLVFGRLDRSLGQQEVATAVDDFLARPCAPFAGDVQRATGEQPAAADATLAAALAPPLEEDVPAVVDPTLRPQRERSTYQAVLDTADVEVSSTEFGVAALFVARKRYDYTKDLALNPYYTERSYGFLAGPRFHFGERNDPNTYRQNIYAFYNYAWLDRGFKDDSRPGVRNSGNVGSFGVRYDYSNVYYYDNPTNQREARLFVDWADPSFGSDYGFVRFGGRVSGTTPLLTPRTIGALELLAGFEEPTSDRGVPIQEQYSLGGRRALRGVSVNEKLARNIGVARAEIRQDVFPEVDFNLMDVLVYRRPQLQLFVDTGQVDDSAGRALNPEHFAIAAGTGINVLYDFLGFFPGRAYIELATRLDRDQTDFQVLFGTRQAF